jgi:hypothetical protein
LEITETTGATERARATDDVLIAGATLFACVCVLFRAKGLVLAQSDVASYVAQSRNVLANDAHLPAYAALVLAARTLTRGVVPDVALMQLVSLGAWCASIVVVARVLEGLAPPRVARFGLAVYGLFPFVGVTYVAWPIADALAHLALALGVLALVRRSAVGIPLAVAAMLIVHKALWPFAALIAAAALARRAARLAPLVAATLPLLALYAFGARHGDLAWMVRADVALNVAPQTSLPVLDGLLGTLALGGARGAVKAAILGALTIATVALALSHARRRELEMLALVVPVLALLALMNQHEIWAAVRFGRVLAIPATVALAGDARVARIVRSRLAFGVLVVALGATQIAFARRIEQTFGAPPSAAQR